MFGSDFPDERATAAALANNLVRSSGHSWEAIFSALEQAAERIAALEQRVQTPAADWHHAAWREPQTIAEAVEVCSEWAEAMSERDQEFIISIAGRKRLSEKQLKWLGDLVVKARTAARMAGAV